MNKTIRDTLKKIILFCLKPFGSAFCSRQYRISILIKQVIIQKILRINNHVPWMVDFTTRVQCPENIIKGSRSPGLSRGCHIDGRNGIKFGNNVWIGPYVCIISMNHDMYDYTQYVQEEPISIGDNCWLCAHSIILPGVQLGNHVIVAAGAVVTKSFEEDNILLAGVPAKIVRRLSPYGTKVKNDVDSFYIKSDDYDGIHSY